MFVEKIHKMNQWSTTNS